MKSSGNSHAQLLRKKVDRNLKCLLNEAEEVLNDVDCIQANISALLESAKITCYNAELENRIKFAYFELNRLDEMLTIINTTIASSICLSMGVGEKLTVENSSQILGSKKNYLMEELMRKLDFLEGEGASLHKQFSKSKDVLEDIMVSAKEVAGKMCSSEVEVDLVETFMEVINDLGALDLRLTMARSAVASSFEVIMKVEQGVNGVLKNINYDLEDVVADDIVASARGSVESSAMCSEVVKEVASFAEVTEEELDKIMLMKLQKNKNLKSICDGSEKHRELVKQRLKENLSRTVCGEETQQAAVCSRSQVSSRILIRYCIFRLVSQWAVG